MYSQHARSLRLIFTVVAVISLAGTLLLAPHLGRFMRSGASEQATQSAEAQAPTADPFAPTVDPALPTADPALPAGDPALPTADPALPTADLGVPTVDPALPIADPALPTADPGVPTVDPALPTVDSLVPTLEAASPTVEQLPPTAEAPAEAAVVSGEILADGSMVVLEDGFGPNWVDASWGTTADLNQSAVLLSGSSAAAIAHTESAGGFRVRANTPVTAAGFGKVSFYLHGGDQGGQALQLSVASGDGIPAPLVPLPAPLANSWMLVEVPLLQLGSPAQISELTLQEAGGSLNAVFYLDRLLLAPESVVAPPTAEPIPPTAEPIPPTATAAPAAQVQPPAPAALQAVETNLLANNGFEGLWKSWRPLTLGTGSTNIHSQATRSGSLGALIRGSARIQQTVAGLSPNTSYTLSGYVHSTASASRAGLYVRNHGGPELQRLVETSGRFELVSLSFTTGPNQTSAEVGFFAPSSDDRIHYADDLTLTGGGSSPAPTATAVPPTATAVPPTATAVPPTATVVPPTATTAPPTATAVAPTATAIAPSATPVQGPAGPNRLANSGFEGQWKSWRPLTLGTGSTNINSQATRSGSFGALIRGSARIQQTVAGLSPNTSYTLSGYVHSTFSTSRAGLYVRNHGGPELQRLVETSGRFELVSLSFTTGPNQTSAEVGFFAPSSDGRIHYADDLTLTGGSGSPAPTATATTAPTSAPAPTATPTGGPLPPADEAIPGQVGQLVELSLTSQGSYSEGDAYTGVAVTAQFTGPSRQSVNVRGFWDGGKSWKVRFTPMEAGNWTVAISNNRGDAGLSRQATLEVAPAEARGFLRRATDYRESFRYDNGERYLMLGQTYYEIVRNARAGGGWKSALANSKAHGLNKVRFLVHPWSERGDIYPVSHPFVSNNHDRLDLAHWRALDSVVAEMQRQGIVAEVILFSDTPLAFGSQSQDERVLRYAMARYAAYTNVIWCLTNEWEFTNKPASYWDRMGSIVRAEDPFMRAGDGALRPLTIHSTTNGSDGGRFGYFNSSWPVHAVIQFGVRSNYTLNPERWGNDSILRNAGRGMPVVNDEYGYLNAEIRLNGALLDRTGTRQALWGLSVAGGYGTSGDKRDHPSGFRPYIASDWYDSPHYDDLLHFQRFWTERGLRYWAFTARNQAVQGTRVHAGGTDDQLVVYAAAGGTVTVTLPAGRSFTAVRYDPRTGATETLGSFQGTATISLPTGNDWVVSFT